MKKIILKKLKIKEKFIPKKYFSSFYKFKNNIVCFLKKIN